jgi:shikimate dehydrogenase
MHREALRRAGLEGDYDILRADEAVLGGVVNRLRRGDLDGVNVTMPLKEAAYRACEELTAEASAAASVNTLRLSAGLVEGHSTDTVAFAVIFGDVPSGSRLHILGAGGSARAAVAAWPGSRPIVSARRPDVAAGLGTWR